MVITAADAPQLLLLDDFILPGICACPAAVGSVIPAQRCDHPIVIALSAILSPLKHSCPTQLPHHHLPLACGSTIHYRPSLSAVPQASLLISICWEGSEGKGIFFLFNHPRIESMLSRERIMHTKEITKGKGSPSLLLVCGCHHSGSSPWHPTPLPPPGALRAPILTSRSTHLPQPGWPPPWWRTRGSDTTRNHVCRF